MAKPARPTGAFLSPELLDEEVDKELRGFLAKRLASESGASEMIHVMLAGAAAVLAWRWVPHSDALLWVAAVAVGAFVRAVFRRTAVASGDAPDRVVYAIRKGVAAVCLAWAVGVLLVGPHLPMEALAWITVIFAGLVAGGTTTLLADPFSYYMLVAMLLVPLSVAIGIADAAGSRVTGIALTYAFGFGMTMFYRRSHAMLLGQFRVAKRLELTERAAGEARESAQRLSRIIEATPDHVGVAGPDGRLRYLNKAGREMIGISPEEDVTKLHILDLAAPRLREHIEREDFPRIARDGFLTTETVFQHRDGREIPVSIVALAHRDANGEIESTSAIARDVTAQVAARDALQTARDAAEQANAAKSAFLANTSHEIRTPLNGVLGMVELLLDTELTPQQRRSVELIAASGETLLNTINDVLDLSKIEADQLELETIPFDLHQLLHSSARLFAASASGAGIELVTDVKREVPQHVVGDPHRLRQILSNLIGNAIKFTSKGEVVLTVSVERENGKGSKGSRRSRGSGGSEAARASRVHFSVRDTGIGIAPDNVARIFKPFGQVDASTTRHYGGTGLGLSISRRLVDLMGGTLEVQSTLGTGSDFHFTLPLPVSTDRVSGAGPAQLAGGMDGLRVLVVEDHPVNRRVTVDMLRWARCDVDDVDSVNAGLEALRSAVVSGRPYRLVVSDVQMPGRDGFDLASEVRARPELQNTTLMLLSSAARRGDNDRCRQLGVAAYLQKPVSRVELLEAAATALSDPDAAHRPALVTRHTIQETRRSLRILLAEDNAVNQEVASAMLRRRGHEVIIVNDGCQAVEAVESDDKLDVVLMDVQMPELDGVEATRQIRARHAGRPMIVALTANVSAEERDRCLAAGMNGYLTKPFKPHELFAAVEGWGAATTAEHAIVDAAVEQPPVDLGLFRATLAEAGIESVGDQMLELFLQDGQKRLATLTEATRKGDAKTIARAAHAFKSGSANVRAQELTAMLGSVEASSSDGDTSNARALLPKITAEFERVAAYLRAELVST